MPWIAYLLSDIIVISYLLLYNEVYRVIGIYKLGIEKSVLLSKKNATILRADHAFIRFIKMYF